MRKFGTDAPDVMTFQLEGSEEVYNLPYAASMPVRILRGMKKAANDGNLFEFQLDMLKEYMGDIVDELDMTTVSNILKAWDEGTKNKGVTMGESSASSE